MPIIDMPVHLLLERANQGARQPIGADDLPKIVNNLGAEVEEVVEAQQFVCLACGKAYDRTPAQGPPVVCSACGVDFREQPDKLDDRGPINVIRIDMVAVRPDIFDPGGMGRAIRGYLGVQTGLTDYALRSQQLGVRVDKRLANEDSHRPHIACAVLRNVTLTDDTIKVLMNLQEDLHWALGRNRKLASIGVYDLDTLADGLIHYDAVAPDELRFTPLGYPDSELTPAEILERHKTGQAFAHLLANFARYPLLRDADGQVLSMPPIINSESTRVTMGSRNLFCDVTGLSQRGVDRALNILVTSLKELMPEMEIEQVAIEGVDGPRVTPDLRPTTLQLDARNACETIGLTLDAPGVAALLEKMGHNVDDPQQPQLQVRAPAWRNDIMHAIDLVEDVAVAYGYENLAPEPLSTFTASKPRAIEEHAAIARQVLAGLGFQQVLTLVLTSEPAAFEKWRQPVHPQRVIIENPISSEQTMCRVSLLPGMLETLAINKQYDLPQHLFEVGDCCFTDDQSDTGASEVRFASAVMIGTHVGYADIRAIAAAFAADLGAQLDVRPTEHPSFIAGRVAEFVRNDEALGVLGELHPEVLEAYGLRHAVAAFELDLQRLLATEGRQN